jgi:hypothetical protein
MGIVVYAIVEESRSFVASLLRMTPENKLIK